MRMKSVYTKSSLADLEIEMSANTWPQGPEKTRFSYADLSK